MRLKQRVELLPDLGLVVIEVDDQRAKETLTLRFERPRSARLEAAARKATNLAPLASYARLLLPELLADRDRVTYLDSDTIVRTDIGALHDLDMDGHACLGVPDIQGEGRMGKVTHLDWQSEDVDPDDIRAVPGTGGPDDAGDVDVDPDELNLPGRS